MVELKDTTFTSTIGAKIRKYRLLSNLSQKKLSNLLGVDCTQFYYYEHDIFYPRYPSLIKMANILKIDVRKLMDDYYLFITNPNYKTFFKNLKLQNKWTYKDIENILGIKLYAYRNWEHGAKLARDVYIKLRKKLFKLKIITKINIKK